jgi:Hypervirulence associated proteins TUDOR domain
VSWPWGSGAPGGTVAEKKTHGEIAIKSKRGNTIKKNASPDNPAVHIERSGNDVVKRVSEVNVEKKASGGQKRKSGHKGQDEDGGGEGDDGLTKNEEGKDVRQGGKKAKKEDREREVNGEKKEKQKGRPKKGDGEEKDKVKKASKPRATEGVGSRTRSRAKA